MTEPSASGPTRFDPTLGERAWIRGTITNPTRLRFTVRSQATGLSFTLAEGPFWGSNFNIDWNGAPPGSSTPTAVGLYDVTVTDVSTAMPAAPVTRQVEIIRRINPEITRPTIQPSPTWDFRNGHITLSASTSFTGSFWVEAHKGKFCNAPIVQTSQQVRGAGPLEGAWDGRDKTGALVTPGDYCVRLAGRTSTGTVIVSPPVAIKAAAPSDGIEVYALTNPGVPAANPAPGTGISAVVVDTGHQTRAAARITIEASPAGPAGSSSQLAARTIAGCERPPNATPCCRVTSRPPTPSRTA